MLEGTVIDTLLDARKVLAGGIELVEHHLQHTRHGAEAVAVDFGQILDDGAHILGIVDADTLVLEMVVQRTLVHVVERQEADDAAVGGHGVHRGVCDEVGAEVAVRQHHALRVARGAGGVDERHPVVGTDGGLAFLEDRHPLLAGGDTGLEYLHHAVFALDAEQRVNLGFLLHTVQSRTDGAHQLGVVDQDEACLAMGEDMVIIVDTQRGIDRHMDNARHGQRHVHKVPFGTVGRDGDDLVARLQPHLGKAVGQVVRILVIVVGTILDPFSVDFLAEDVGLLREFLLQMVEQIESTCDVHRRFIEI